MLRMPLPPILGPGPTDIVLDPPIFTLHIHFHMYQVVVVYCVTVVAREDENIHLYLLYELRIYSSN